MTDAQDSRGPKGGGAGARASAARNMEPMAHRSQRILVVDDSQEARDLLSNMLRRMTGLEVVRARSGLEAMTEFAASPPLITFLDIQMDDISGLEVLRRIREADSAAFVAMVSGESSARNVRNAFAAGAGAFVVKPFRPSKIAEALERFSARTGIHIEIRLE